MQPFKYYTVFNAIWYQALWFTALLGRGQYVWVVGLLLIVHFVFSPSRKTDWMLLVSCGGLGICVDNLLAYVGVYIFPEDTGFMFIPLWLAGIWMGFSCTLLHSFNFFMRRPKIGTVAIAALAPFSYLAGSKFGAVGFGFEQTTAMLVIAACWALIIPAFSAMCRLYGDELEVDT